LLRESDSEGTFHASVLPPPSKISLAAKAQPKRTKRTKREQDDEEDEPAIVFLQNVEKKSLFFLLCFLKDAEIMDGFWVRCVWEMEGSIYGGVMRK